MTPPGWYLSIICVALFTPAPNSALFAVASAGVTVFASVP